MKTTKNKIDDVYTEICRDMAGRKDQLAVRRQEMMFHIVRNHYLARAKLDELIKPFGMTLPGYNILTLLRHWPKGLFLKELSQWLLVTKANITGLVKSLEKKKLIERLKDHPDQRRCRVRLRAQGQEALNAYRKIHENAVSRMTSALSKKEIGTMVHLLKKLRSNILSSALAAALALLPFRVGAMADQAPDQPALKLSMAAAIDMALQKNLRTALAIANTVEAKAKALNAASALLPKILGAASQSRVFKENLESQGFVPGEGFNVLLGPFNSFDARFFLSQKIFDLGSYWSYRQGKSGVKIAASKETVAAEEVAASAALGYLQAVQAQRSVDAAQSDEKLAASLLDLAKDQSTAGLGTGVDVVRAKTRLAQYHLRVIKTKTAERQTLLFLSRIIGSPLKETLDLTDPLVHRRLPSIPLPEALLAAQNERPELQVAASVIDADQEALSAAKAGSYPTVEASADYGLSGTSLPNSEKVSDIGARVSVPIFTGGHIKADTREQEARLKEAVLTKEDLSKQVEEDVRVSVENLNAAEEEVAAADQAVELAERELEMARDRYAAGVGDNINLIAAQDVLAGSHKDQIDALALNTAARINFEMALGRARFISKNLP